MQAARVGSLEAWVCAEVMEWGHFNGQLNRCTLLSTIPCNYFAYTANEQRARILASRGKSCHLLWLPLCHFRVGEDLSAWEVRPEWALGPEDLERLMLASWDPSCQLVPKG